MSSPASIAAPDPGAAVTPALAAAGLACRRGNRLLFKQLDLELHPGQVLWLRGANGRGKTSLLRLLAGLSTPEEGRVQRARPDPGMLLYIGHAHAVKDDLTALESLRFLARLHGMPDDAAALSAALGRFGLGSRQHALVRTLSQGQRKRVALARLALQSAPAVWILDEPFDALDAEGVETLNALIGAHAQRGGSVVLTSHQPLTLVQPQPAVFQLDAAA